MYKYNIKNIFSIGFVFLSVFFSKETFSQGNLSGNLILNNPSPYVSDWATNSSMAMLTIVNTKRTMQARVDVLLRKDGASISSVLTGNITQIPGPQTPGTPVTTIYRSDNIASWGNLSLTGPIGQIVIQTGRLPEGNYEVCIDITETDPPPGPAATLHVCANFNLLIIQPPRLINPRNNALSNTAKPVFNWTGILGIPNINYHIKIVEVLTTQSPEQAINNLAFYENNTSNLSFPYPISAPALTGGKKYAWQVQSFRDGNTIGQNDGKSEVFSFSINTSYITIIPNLSRPSILKVSNFRISVDSWDSPSKSLDQRLPSGKGHTTIPGSTINIPVNFSDVVWNGSGTEVDLTSGFAYFSSVMTRPAPPPQVKLTPATSTFELLIDSLVLIPQRKAQASGFVKLPKSIVSTSCDAKLPLPLTEISFSVVSTFSSNVPGAAYGKFYIGETDIQIQGVGYNFNFGILTPTANRGVTLINGETVSNTTDSIINNRGYTKARYTFSNAKINSAGFIGKLNLQSAFTFYSLDPFGYEINLPQNSSSYLNLEASKIKDGQFANSVIKLPEKAVRNSSMGRVQTQPQTLIVQNDMDLLSQVQINGSLTWGEFSKTNGTPKFYQLENNFGFRGDFYLAARYMNPYYPLTTTGAFDLPNINTQAPDAGTQLEAKSMQGITISDKADKFTVFTKDLPETDTSTGLVFVGNSTTHIVSDLNIIRTGAHSNIQLTIINTIDNVNQGPTWSDKYKGITPFNTSYPGGNNDSTFIKIQFVESATYYSNFNGKIRLEGGIKNSVSYKNMVYTSTANNAGGKVDLSIPLKMEHWGVDLVAKDNTKPAGVVCVKLGVIYLTAAGISEPRHFSKPFYLTWGEIRANGDLGRLLFDYNNSGQKFDGFAYTPDMVALSNFFSLDSSSLYTHGAISIGFFGPKKLMIVDYKSIMMDSPFNKRYVVAMFDQGTDGKIWNRNWTGVSNLNFEMEYYSLIQNGFVGSGVVTAPVILGGSQFFNSTMITNSETSCFRLSTQSSSMNLNLCAMQLGSMVNVWGCGCIRGERLEVIAVGGELSTVASSGMFMSATSANVGMIISLRPSRLIYEVNGGLMINLVGNMRANASALAVLTFDYYEGSAKGYIKGNYDLYLASLEGISGTGEMDWYFGSQYNSIQGKVSVKIWNFEGGIGNETGIFVGNDTPRETIWILDGIDGRFGINRNLLPLKVTGIYVYAGLSKSLSTFLVSGGFQTFTSLGTHLIGGLPEVWGNLGVRVWGKILGGVLSAEAGAQLVLLLGIPPGFQGSVWLEACALFVCTGTTINLGFNKNDGFYIGD